MSAVHKPVLLDAAIECLAVKAPGVYVDGTFGRGGHASALLAHLAEDGKLIVMDKDPSAIQFAQEKFAGDGRVSVIHDSFANMKQHLASLNLLGRVNGILLDLGVSSPQLDEGERGFSFSKDGPLDMRMNPTTSISAAEWVASASESEITHVLKIYGEERFAKRIARAIVTEREKSSLVSTSQLADVIAGVVPRGKQKRHPATKSFQGIRIFINDELNALKQILDDVLDMLAVGGRLAVISFHSLEDRIVKRYIKQYSEEPEALKRLPISPAQYKCRLHKLKKCKASAIEIASNPRARSAVLRGTEKIA